MKILFYILAFILSVPAGSVSAQTPEKIVDDIIAAASDACITVGYSLDAKVDDVRVRDRGTIVAQDDIWYMKGEAVEIYTCEDGTWILHPESKEAMIEPKWTYDDLKAFYRTHLKSPGNGIDVKVISRIISEKKPASYFVPDTGSDWVVTDLR